MNPVPFLPFYLFYYGVYFHFIWFNELILISVLDVLLLCGKPANALIGWHVNKQINKQLNRIIYTQAFKLIICYREHVQYLFHSPIAQFCYLLSIIIIYFRGCLYCVSHLSPKEAQTWFHLLSTLSWEQPCKIGEAQTQWSVWLVFLNC